MIHLALQYIVGEMNAYLNLRSPALDQSRVVNGSLFTLEGTVNNGTRDKIAVMLVNIEEDHVYRSVETFQKRPDGTSQFMQPEKKVNVYLLFVANFADYDESLKAVAQVISFFQHRHSFDYAAIPALSIQEGRMLFDLFSPSFEQQNHLWGTLGAKYMPSVMYKVGLIDIRDEQIEAEVPPIEEILINE